MRSVLVAGVLAAALAGAGPAGAAPVHVVAGLAPRAVFFGDRVVAQVDVVVDPRAVDPGRSRLAAPLGDWSELGPTRVETTRAGKLVRRSWRLVLACRASECVPSGASAVMRLPAARVTTVALDGTVRRLTVRWPPLTVAARVPQVAAAASVPPFRLQVAPPPPRPRVAASTAAALLDAAAALLAAVALVLVGLELRRRRAPAARAVSPLARALALAREAQARPAGDRRRALALLSRVAAPRDASLSSDAAATAWERAEPEPERLAELVRRAERLGERP